MQHEPLANIARGKWRGILMSFGVDEKALRNRHGPCPLCGGTDRFRFDDKEGRGTYICGQCGSGSGVDLLMKHKGWDFKTAAREVETLLGRTSIKAAVKEGPSDEEIREQKRALWRASVPIARGDAVDRYLRARGLGLDDYPEALRTVERARVSFDQWLPCMVAVVVDVDGKPASLHRTFLGDGCKANIESPRKMMPGPIPEGACVRLSGPREEICLAEGIETALAVERLFQTPCWATISAAMMAKWIAPPFVKSVTIFADNDANYTGHAAAYALAKRLVARGVEANVRLPEDRDTDWCDVLARAA